MVIPVYNDAEGLKLCLEALAKQTYPRHLTEIIVVDNGSENSKTIEEIAQKYDRVIYTQEAKIGSYAARNQGISIARGEIIAFTDADCIATHNWLAKGVSNLLKTSQVGLVAGKIDLVYRHGEIKTAVELYESIMAFRQQEFLQKIIMELRLICLHGEKS